MISYVINILIKTRNSVYSFKFDNITTKPGFKNLTFQTKAKVVRSFLTMAHSDRHMKSITYSLLRSYMNRK